MDKKILLVELPNNLWTRYRKHNMPCNASLAIGTYLKSRGHNVKIIDSNVEGVGWNGLRKIIENEQPDVVGSGSYTSDIYERILLARLVKKANPSIVTIFGGCHITLASEETLTLAKSIDYAVLGEGEESFLELLTAIERGAVKKDMHSIEGIAYFEKGTYVRTDPRPLIKNLDDLPMPDYSMIPMDKYRIADFNFPGKEGFMCSFSRGCTGQCSFCLENAIWNNSWRGRSAKKIVEELRFLNKKFGKKGFLFNDNNFLFCRSRNIEFIEEMGRSGLKIEFSVLTRVDTLLRDRDLLKGLRSVGLTGLKIGIESYQQDIIRGINKNYNPERIKEMFYHVKNSNIPFLMLLFIIGNYEDEKESLSETISKTKRYCPSAVVKISYLTPWPGTKLFEEMNRQNRIKILDYRRYNFVTPIAATKYIGLKELRLMRLFLFFKWYLDISVFFNNLFNKRLRCFHIRNMIPSLLHVFCSKLMLKSGAWRLFWYNRFIEQIYREHLLLVKKE